MLSEDEIRKKLSTLESELENHISSNKERFPNPRFYTLKYQYYDEIRTLKWVLEIKER